MSCDSKYSLALPLGAMGWSAVYDCGIPDHTHLLFRALFRYIIGFMKQMHIHSSLYVFVKTYLFIFFSFQIALQPEIIQVSTAFMFFL